MRTSSVHLLRSPFVNQDPASWQMAVFDAQGALRLRVVTAVLRQATTLQRFLGDSESVVQNWLLLPAWPAVRHGSVVRVDRPSAASTCGSLVKSPINTFTGSGSSLIMVGTASTPRE